MKVYRHNFEHKDFERLAEALAGLKGRFLMSLNDHKQVRRIFKPFRIEKVSTKYSCMGPTLDARASHRHELLIRNY